MLLLSINLFNYIDRYILSAVEKPIPEELLTVERLPRPMNERRPERCHRESGLRVHPKQPALRARLVPCVRIRHVIRYEWGILMMIEARSIHCDARHEYIPMQVGPRRPR